MQTWVIYGLVDPLERWHFRYIGKTECGASHRYRAHIKAAIRGEPDAKYHWIRKLLREGRMPIMLPVEFGEEGDSDWESREEHWIWFYRNEGHRLLNETDGGEGQSGRKPSAETIAKIVAHRLGKPLSEAHKRSLSIALTGHTVSAAQREKLRQANLGKRPTEETRRKMVNTHRQMVESWTNMNNASPSNKKGRAPLPGEIERLSYYAKNPSADTIRKITETSTGRFASSELRAKLSAMHKGVPKSAESIANGKKAGFHARLDYNKACEIRRRYATNPVSMTVLAKEYGTTRNSIHCILNGRTYASPTPKKNQYG